jgi:peptidoglycan/LPS O-acetylase OafA/YrhL
MPPELPAKAARFLDHRAGGANPPARPRQAAIDLQNTGSADSHVIRYRADVDGLRAVAVLAVVFFHLSRRGLPGGYLGVDMFFVLSGYLITAIIWREIQGARFSIARFYDRRIRRIMPALLLVLFVTTAAAALLLLPSDLIGYGKSLLATLAFSANIYFWRDTDYFSSAAEQKPLLHIWSLGVEEQFYLLFPLILVLLARRWPRRTLYAVGTLTLGSLGADMYAVFAGGDLPAFFLLPTRAWELGTGAILALLPAGAAPRSASANATSSASATVISSIGALLIAMAILHPFGAYWIVPPALPAVAGTALVILGGQSGSPWPNRILQLRPLVFLGLISYSLYLWHWPIIVFGQYYLVRSYTLLEAGAALLLMAACAAATWWFVERPFRSKEMPMRTVRLAAGAGTALVGTAAAALLWSQGLPGRLSAAAAVINQAVDTNYRCSFGDYLAFGASRACVMNLQSRKPADADVVLLGNSHAQMYAPLWASILAGRGQSGLLVPANGCLPTVQANISRACIDIAAKNLAEVSALPRAGLVILGLNWRRPEGELIDADGRAVDDGDNRVFVRALDDLIDRLQRTGKQVLLIGPIAEPGWDVASTLSRQLAFGRAVNHPQSLPAAEFESRFGSSIRHFEERHDIGFARPDRAQCDAERCYYVLDGRALFADSNHIAVAELPRFRALFEAALPPTAVAQQH